ncbi:uncharacterized protein [Primulina huaijiensis]|uniref:uncharacterized protein isoform X1 n=1 Tax=Primulina huaijiensis TaxID=1492673 RepID=UPI003CC77069
MEAPASSQSSVSNSQVSATHSSLARVEPPADESKEIMGSEEQSKESIKDPIDIMEVDEPTEKLQRYEADYKQYLMSKYFTDKTIFGGNIFDVKMNIDGHTTTAARLPPFQSYLDPVSFDDQNNKGSVPPAETTAGSNSDGKPEIP